MTLTDAQRLLDDAWTLRDINRQQATKLLDSANQFLLAQEHPSNQAAESAQLQVILGFFLFRDARFEAAIQCLQHALTVLDRTGDHLWLARAHGTLGIAFVFAGINQGAVASIQKQVSLSKQLKDTAQLGMAYQSLSWIYMQRESYQDAAIYLQESIDIHKSLGVHFQVALSLANLASCYIHLDQANLAQEALDESLSLCEAHGFDLVGNTAIQNNGFLEDRQGILTGSFGYYDQSLGVVEAMDDNYSVVRALIKSGQLYTDSQGRDKAINCLTKALTLAQELKARELIYTIHAQFANTYEAFGEYQLALEHHRLFHRARESVFIEQSELRVQTLQVRHETEQAQREATWLHAQNSVLEQRVLERTQALEETARQLQQAHEESEALSRLKSQIIANTSHEFRTPLTTIHSSVELLIQHFDKLGEQKRYEIGQRIRSAIHYLTDLLHDVELVDTTHNQGPKPTMRALPFATLWGELSSQISAETSSPNNLVFHFEESATDIVHTDTTLLKQMMIGLVSNALKYSSPDDPVTVQAWLEGNTMRIAVRDLGIGIPKEEQPLIWELLYRGSNVETRRGLGLGLYIVRQLTHALGGSIYVASAGCEQGTSFTVQLPKAIPESVHDRLQKQQSA